MRPRATFLDEELTANIIAEAIDLLGSIGVGICHGGVLGLLADCGVRVDADKSWVWLTEEIIQKAISAAPSSFKLYDTRGDQTHNFAGKNIHFTPGSSAIYFLDSQTQQARRPDTSDYITYTKIADQLGYIAGVSTAFIPADVPEKISDSYRLFLSLLYGHKPVDTGAFSFDSFATMKDLQLIMRGSVEGLKQKPLTIFSCCPNSPLQWGQTNAEILVECGRYFNPVEIVPMPLAGLTAPVTLVGALIQHTAEILSGVVISQLSHPGTPILFGGSAAPFDVRYQTTPMGAVESMMLACGYNEIGKHLGLPTQAYITLSDAKFVDAQAGMESGFGAALAAIAGINSISGPGLIDFENCFSIEKLIFDNDLCGMCLRLAEGISAKDDFPILPLMQELFEEKHLLIADHTRRHLKTEHFFPSDVIDRTNREQYQQQGSKTLDQRIQDQKQKLLDSYEPPFLTDQQRNDLVSRMQDEGRRHGMDSLPGSVPV